MLQSKFRETVCAQVARQLRETRVRQGLSMTRLSDEAGLSRATISFVENELRNPTLDTLLRICSVLKVELADVLKDATQQAARKRSR